MTGVLRVDRIGPGGTVARVMLARPEVRNAFNAELIAALRDTFTDLAEEGPAELRAVVLGGEGRSFSAGADIAWQRAAIELSMEDNERDAARLQEMLAAIDLCPAPVVARVQGAALGGGMGLCCVADVVLATADARFGFTETKLGLLPAVISPFVLPRIGEGELRALFTTGERIGAERARAIGLVHEIVADEAALDARVDAVVAELLASGPEAVRAAKRLIREARTMDAAAFAAHTVRVAARQRVSAEGQEGLTAFLENRTPSWRSD